MNIFKMAAIAVLGCFAIQPAIADNATFSYDTGSGPYTYFGSQKKETYNIAISLKDKSFAGRTISSIRVPFKGPEGLSGFKVWGASELSTIVENGTRTFKPDLFEQASDISSADEYSDVILTTPYVIPEGGAYIGFSVTVDELTYDTKFPVKVAGTPKKGGFYVYSSRSYKNWIDTFEADFVACIQVVLSDVSDNCAGISDLDDVRGQCGKPAKSGFFLRNHGLKPITSVDYVYEVNGNSFAYHKDFASDPISAVYDSRRWIENEVPTTDVKGVYPLSLTVTKVNGSENTDAAMTMPATMYVYTVLPVHRAVMEEYTGLWCGYCPRGLVALEKLSKIYGDDFIGISYHNNDPMEVVYESNFPNKPEGYPWSYIDRLVGSDPFFGTSGKNFGIESDWLDRRKQFCPVAVNIAVDDNNDTALSVETEFFFTENVEDADLSAEFLLLADDMHSPSWEQSNYFSGDHSMQDFPEFDRFVEADDYYADCHFNDVVVYYSASKGEKISLPGTVKEDESVKISYTFPYDKCVSNKTRENLIQDKKNLSAVVLLINNATGEIMNAAKVKAGDSGVDNIIANTIAGEPVYYDLNGRVVANPSKGIYIMRGSDGKVAKIMR